MSSQVRYRFKNAVAEDTVAFDGAVIQIGDVKRLIAIKRGLGAEGAAELTLFDPSTGEEHADDAKVVPRNTLVLVKRAPAARFKPLSSAAGGVVASAPAAVPAVANGQQQLNAAAAAAADADEFGGDCYSEKPTPALVAEDEEAALASRLQGTAQQWQREVRQGALRGRGRGRGGSTGVPYDYRCPRCEAVAQHWVQDCPTQGDPAYDRKRVRPPVGIPMTRLALSEEGGLVLPGGQMGTLVANEDAFAREILGLPTAAAPPGEQQQAAAAAGDAATSEANPAVLLLDNKPAAQVPAAAAVKPEPGNEAAGTAGTASPALPAAQPIVQPLLAGEAELAPLTAMPGADFFSMIMQSALLPRGPPDFLRAAFDRPEPLSRAEFERMQDDYLARYRRPPLRHPEPPRRRTPPPHRSPLRQRSPPRRPFMPQRSPPRDRERDRSREGRRSRSRQRSRSRRRSRSRGSRELRRSRSRSRERSSRPLSSKDARNTRATRDAEKDKTSKSSRSGREERSHRTSRPEKEDREEGRRKRSRERSRSRDRLREQRHQQLRREEGVPKEDRWQPAEAAPAAVETDAVVSPGDKQQPRFDDKSGDVRPDSKQSSPQQQSPAATGQHVHPSPSHGYEEAAAARAAEPAQGDGVERANEHGGVAGAVAGDKPAKDKKEKRHKEKKEKKDKKEKKEKKEKRHKQDKKDRHKEKDRDGLPREDNQRHQQGHVLEERCRGKGRSPSPDAAATASAKQPRPSAQGELAAASKQDLRRAPSDRDRDRKLFGTALTAAVRDTRAGEEEARHRSSKRHRK